MKNQVYIKSILGITVLSGLGLFLFGCNNGTTPSTDTTASGASIAVIAGVNQGVTPSATPISATSAKIYPSGIAVVDADGNKYIADTANKFIEKMDAATGMITVIAGSADGATPSTTPSSPTSVTILPRSVVLGANNNLYIADGNGYVEEIDGSTGLLRVIAGNEDGSVPSTTLTSPTSVKISPNNVTVDANNNIYITDEAGYVEEIFASSGLFKVIAGNNSGESPTTTFVAATSVQVSPGGIAVDAENNIYITDYNGYVEQITNNQLKIIAGSTGGGVSPTTTYAPATAVEILPYGIAVDSSSNLYVADYDGYIEQITDGQLKIIAGNINGSTPTTTAESPTAVNILARSVAVDASDNIYVVDYNGYVEEIEHSTGLLQVIAGTFSGTTPNAATVADPTTISTLPYGIDRDLAGNIYIADGANGYVEEISATTGLLSVIAGNPAGVTPTTVFASPTSVTLSPNDVKVDVAGNIYIADGNGYIEEIFESTGQLKVIAGTESGGATPSATVQILPTTAKILPYGVAIDSQSNIYIADAYNNYVEEIYASSGNLAVIAGAIGGMSPSTRLESPTSVSIAPYDMAVDATGNIYIADNNGYIEELFESNGKMRVIAGKVDGDAPTVTPVAATSVALSPNDVAIDPTGNVYIADNNGYVEEISADTGLLQVIAGNNNGSDPTTTAASPTSVLLMPSAVVADSSGVVYIADYNGYVERFIP